MTLDELKAKVLEIMPEAIFDETYRTGELVISTGLIVSEGEVKPLDDEFLS